MKKILVVVAAAAGVALAPSPLARADSVDQYMADMSAAGFDINTQTEVLALAMGLGVCVDMFNGNSYREEVAEVMSTGMDANSANELVSISVTNLCPGATAAGVA